MKKLIPAIVLFTLLTVALQAQQLSQLTQFNQSMMLYNPAFAGDNGALSLTAFYRNQWMDVEGAPTTQSLIAHTPITARMGVGVSVYNDAIGPHDTFNFTGNYAYRIGATKNRYVAFGIQAGFSSQRADYASLSNQVVSGLDPQLQGVIINNSAVQFGAGILVVQPKFKIGYSALNLMPQEVEVTDSLSYALNRTNHFGFIQFDLPIGPMISIIPAALVKYVDGLSPSIEGNVRLSYKSAFYLGAHYRSNESLAASLQLKLTPQLTLGYAHDFLTGDINALSPGSNEFMLQYVFRFKQNLTSPR